MNIIIAGNYGAHYLGDEMILEGLLASIKSVASKANITVLSADPANTTKLHHARSAGRFPAGIRSLIRSLLEKNSPTKDAIKNCNYFILGGGGLFAGPSLFANFIWGIQAKMAIYHKKKILMYGQSVGKSQVSTIKNLIKKLFNKSELITVRDDKSKQNLTSMGVTGEITVIPDLAFRVEYKNSKDQREDTAIIALRHKRGFNGNLIKAIAQFLTYLKKNKRIKLKTVNFQEKGPENDEKLVELVRNAMPQVYRTCLPAHKSLMEHEKIRETLNSFARAKFVLAMRLHSVICAIKTKTPFIAINYAPKVENLLHTLGLESQIIDIHGITGEKLIEKYEETMKHKNELTAKMEEINKKAISRHKIIEDTILRNILGDDR